MAFDIRFDWGDDEVEDVRLTLRKTNSSGLSIPIPGNFDVCDAPPSALDGRWELDSDHLGDGGGAITITLDIDDDQAVLTYEDEDGDPERSRRARC